MLPRLCNFRVSFVCACVCVPVIKHAWQLAFKAKTIWEWGRLAGACDHCIWRRSTPSHIIADSPAFFIQLDRRVLTLWIVNKGWDNNRVVTPFLWQNELSKESRDSFNDPWFISQYAWYDWNVLRNSFGLNRFIFRRTSVHVFSPKGEE